MELLRGTIHVGGCSRREGLQLMLGAARAVLLAATGCQARLPSPGRSGGWVERSKRPATIGKVGGYTSFPFVTQRKPPDNHTGCASRPPYSGSNPQNAAFIDPMSGLPIFRLTPNRGASILINNMTDTGLKMPSNLKGENNVSTNRGWNSDGTLLMLNDSKSRSADPSNPCRMALIDVDGHHGNSGPWRFLRAWGSTRDPGVGVNNWFWDPLNPLRAYLLKENGMYEWWPAGGPGRSVGEQNFLFGYPSGLTHFHLPESHHSKVSYDGIWYHAACRRTSDGKRGGVRVNLQTGAFNSFWPHPLAYLDGGALSVIGTGPDGVYSAFNHVVQGNPKTHQFINMITGERSTNYTGTKEIGGHPYLFVRDGVTYLFGTNTSTSDPVNWSGLRESDDALVHFADDVDLSVEHVGTQSFKDLWQTYPMPGGPSSGLRYALVVCSNPAARRGIMGLRLGHGDFNQWRYICHHRTVRTDNGNECHPQPQANFRRVLFPSNWCAPGVETDLSHVNNYVVLIPDAWYSPNNDGS